MTDDPQLGCDAKCTRHQRMPAVLDAKSSMSWYLQEHLEPCYLQANQPFPVLLHPAWAIYPIFSSSFPWESHNHTLDQRVIISRKSTPASEGTDRSGFPSSFLFPSICICTFTRSVGLAKNCPMAPADMPPTTAFLPNREKMCFKMHWKCTNCSARAEEFSNGTQVKQV